MDNFWTTWRRAWWAALLCLCAVSSALAARGGKAKTNRADYYKPAGGDLDPEEELISKNISVVPFPISRLQRFGPCVDMFPEVILEDEAVQYMKLLLFPPLMLLGVLSTLLSLPVLHGLRSAWSTVSYLMVLSVTDLVVLLVICGDFWWRAVFEAHASLTVKIMNFSRASCNTYLLAFNFVNHLSPWLVVALAIETLVATRWHRLAHVWCTLERFRNVMLLFTVIFICINIHFFWTYDIMYKRCVYSNEFTMAFKQKYWPMIDEIVRSFLPLASVTALGALGAWTAFYSRRRDPQAEQAAREEMAKHFLELPAMLEFRQIGLVLCLMFVCVAAFDAAISLVNFYNVNYIVLDPMVKEQCYQIGRYDIVYNLLTTLKTTLWAVFYCSKLWVYIALSKTFKRRLLDGFRGAFRRIRNCCRSCCCCCCCRKGNSQTWSLVSSTSGSSPAGECEETASAMGR